MRRARFTLIELMIVVAMIGILVSLLLPSLNRAREEAKRAVCLSNQSQLYRTAILYAKDSNRILPSGEANGVDSYLGQPGDVFYNAIVKYSSLDVYSCPSNILNKINRPFYYNIGERWVAAQLYIANLNTSGWPVIPYESPRGLFDKNSKPIIACRTMSSVANKKTYFAHGSTGGGAFPASMKDIKVAGASGVTVVRLNGAAKMERSLSPYQTYSGSSQEKSFLPSDSND